MDTPGAAPHLEPDAIARIFNYWGAGPVPQAASAPRPAPIPSAADWEAAALLDAVRAGPPAFREAVAARIDQGGAGALIISAARLAALAVRTRARIHLERALLALALASQGTTDYRDVLTAIDVPARSARLIRVDPVALYEEMAAVAPTQGAELLRQLTPRGETGPLAPQPGRKVGGYVEAMDEEGFRYDPAPLSLPTPRSWPSGSTEPARDH